MPFVGPDNPKGQFCVHVWRDAEDDKGAESYYTSKSEAEVAFGRLEASGNFICGGLYEWVGTWRCHDNWPEDWDSESDYPPD